jgi:hypothetical protein
MNNQTETKIKGKIQAWLINEDDSTKAIFVKDYFSYKKNLTPNQYLIDLANISRGITTDLQIKYIALSTAYDPPNRQTILENEFTRVEPLSFNQVNNKLIIEAKFDTSFTKSVSITSVTNKKIFTVSSNSGFLVGDRIQVKINNTWEQKKLVNISSNTFTVHEDFSSLPFTGTDNCQQMISRLHLIYGSGATLSLNSGKACSLAQLIAYKPSTKPIFTRHEIEFLGA